MARGDILLVTLPESDKREEKELAQQLPFKRMMSNRQC
jgi:hypothetical protein